MNYSDVETFLGLGVGAFDHIPHYARRSALEAIAKVRKLEQQHIFRPGLYYIALVDLSGSTVASEKLGAVESRKRVEWFVTACVEALGEINLRNYVQFVKEIGDATLFIFSSFDDLLDWTSAADTNFEKYSSVYEPAVVCDDEDLGEYFRIRTKKVVHLGEVAFSGKANPLALAINQVFKIEKLFGPGQLGCTNVVANSVKPLLKSRGLSLRQNVPVTLPQEKSETMTWIVQKVAGRTTKPHRGSRKRSSGVSPK
jgi:class 3 adenylate cyclase